MIPDNGNHFRPVQRKADGYLRHRLAVCQMRHNIVSMSKILLMVMMIVTIFSVDNITAGAQAMDLSPYQWKNRLLFLFAPDRFHPMYDALHKSLAAQASEVADRDLVIFEVLESDLSLAKKDMIDSESARLLREKFGVDRGDFAVILVGKDGGTKLKRKGRTPLKDIFALIDSMPMRQEEMRQKAN
jgi:hypothetical protein